MKKKTHKKIAKCPICSDVHHAPELGYAHSLGAVCRTCKHEFYPRRKNTVPLFQADKQGVMA